MDYRAIQKGKCAKVASRFRIVSMQRKGKLFAGFFLLVDCW